MEKSVKRADYIQARFLLQWLRENRGTEFGKKYGFEDIDSVSRYRQTVPLSTYADYEGAIQRIIGGERNVLTARDAVYFCLSSGTVGDEKYIPLTDHDLAFHYLYMYGGVFGQVREYYRDLPEDAVFGKIFQIGEFAKTYMPDGRMNGIRSSCVYQWLDEREGFDASDYCVPKEVLFPRRLEDMTYVKARFALAERDLTAIHGVFINRVAGMVEYILRHWDLLLRDMELGSVSVCVDEKQRGFLSRLPPDPRRARELQSIPREDLSQGIVKKIWNKMKYILAIGGESFSYYTQKMREYAGDVPIHFFVYAASEGVFALAERVDQADRYVLLPESAFFEFIPVDGGGEDTVLMGELEHGRKYEVVITNRSGLYRYRMGDVVEIAGWRERAAVVKFCYRRNQVINLAGEKSNQQQFDAAVLRFAQRARTEVRGYCVREDTLDIAPRYLIYMECVPILDGADEMFESCLCAANPEYRSCRDMGEIEPLHIEFLREGSFARYERQLARSGKPLAQCKIPHFLDSEGKRRFFASQVMREGDG